MFTHPASPSAPGVSASTASAAAVSSTPATSPTSRTSRLRGFSYLRNYTQTHLLSRDHHGGGGSNGAHSSGSGAAGGSSSSSSSTRTNLVRSASNPPSAPAPTSPTSASAGSRLSQVASNPTPAAAHDQQHQHLAIRPPNPNSQSSQSSQSSQPPADVAAPSVAPNPTTSSLSNPAAPQQGVSTGQMARHISGTASQVSGPQVSGATAEGMVSAPSVNGGAADAAATAAAASNGPSSGPSGTLSPENLPSIRFSAYYDPRSSRPSLIFPPMTRTLPTGTEVIRVGRYSDRELRPAPSAPGRPSAAPVGFKSKVVSRRHCEFWYDRGQWWIKDVKSSSGTFLNHIRLSSPGVESKPFPVNDGDIVQLGIDFKGGEEMIFRCVKMRLELNRNWQRNLNTFNMAIHKKLRNMTTSGSSSYSQDCSICLNSIAPCQSLFVAPCSHTWHYKCIRLLLSTPQYPVFTCPNCRGTADLEAEVDDSLAMEEWEQLNEEQRLEEQRQIEQQLQQQAQNANGQSAASASAARADPDTTVNEDQQMLDAEIQEQLENDVSRAGAASSNGARPQTQTQSARAASQTNGTGAPQSAAASGPTAMDSTTNAAAPGRSASGAQRPQVNTALATGGSPGRTNQPAVAPVEIPAPSSASAPQPIARTPPPRNGSGPEAAHGANGGAPASLNGNEGPITPRNNAGPWVFDGSAHGMGGVLHRHHDSRTSTDEDDEGTDSSNGSHVHGEGANGAEVLSGGGAWLRRHPDRDRNASTATAADVSEAGVAGAPAPGSAAATRRREGGASIGGEDDDDHATGGLEMELDS